ncbi:replication protein A [Pseudomonas aeruginosa]|uniref:helicase RepA family protein n=1 Tax=Pseudomonas aeruginosa TaxID=287 RepID=UPI00071B05B3|nr:helicase RepA family protein [Pseudomonas aeruginosa]KSL62093.1 replication protein A [Pseudomonas aeruginosa]KSM76444.1 replication protein A [Pseudomonas aeruginosa]MDI2556697.1 helicase RepA family protein [Pseudomonas aeruginosa]UVH93516.1 helicase RepA family protein [Pseudomonas aeruginosa]HBN9631097.1 AAA family ATPase [Pseudomonas aeruginosa]
MAIDLLAAFENEPPVLDFIWPGFLAGTVGALVAPGATGKSFWALEAAMSIACSVAGGDLIGLAPARTGRVVYLAGEDPPSALVCRVHAIGKHLSQQAREAIAENLTLEPILGNRLNVMEDRHLARVIEFCADARLIVLDTLSRIHSLDENSNSDMARLVATLEYVAASTGASVLYLHHVSKGSAREGQTDQQQAARGASALIDNARWCGFVEKMTEKDAVDLSDRPYDRRPIGKDRRGFFVRFGVSKQNYDATPLDQWYRRHDGGVLLPTELVKVKPENEDRTRGKGYAAAAY